MLSAHVSLWTIPKSQFRWGLHDCRSNWVLIGLGRVPSKRTTATTSAGSTSCHSLLMNGPAVQRCTSTSTEPFRPACAARRPLGGTCCPTPWWSMGVSVGSWIRSRLAAAHALLSAPGVPTSQYMFGLHRPLHSFDSTRCNSQNPSSGA